MSYSRLRVFYGPRETEPNLAQSPPHKATVPLGDILPILADALRHRRSWINDFLDDDITISSDLYDVLLAYEHHRKPAG